MKIRSSVLELLHTDGQTDNRRIFLNLIAKVPDTYQPGNIKREILVNAFNVRIFPANHVSD